MTTRMHVKPAVEGAQIIDPDDMTVLPPEGRSVRWSIHWERLKQRGGEILISEAQPDAAPEPEPALEPAPAPQRAVRSAPQRAPQRPVGPGEGASDETPTIPTT